MEWTRAAVTRFLLTRTANWAPAVSPARPDRRGPLAQRARLVILAPQELLAPPVSLVRRVILAQPERLAQWARRAPKVLLAQPVHKARQG
jgi:hypothetical protein